MEEAITTEAIPVNEEGKTEGVVQATTTESGDPLEALLSEPEKLLAKAKEYKTSYHRVKQERDELKTQSKPETSQFITKQDQQRVATKEAKKLVDAPILENWDKIIEYVPPKYKGAETADEIAKAMKIAHVAYLAENPVTDTTAKDATAALQADAGVRGSAAPQKTATAAEEKAERMFPKLRTPETWYKPKTE